MERLFDRIGERGRQLRRGRARAGADRRRARLHRAADPRRPVRRLARGRDLPARPRAARRRDARRDHRRHHHALQRLPDGHDHLDRSGRSSTSRSRTRSSSRASRPGRSRSTRSSCSSSVLFGSTLFGVLGALLAIPVAAAIQISIIEYANLRRPENIAAVQRRRAAGRRAAARRARPPERPDGRSRSSGRGRRSAAVARAAGHETGQRGDPAADHEARDGRADQHLLAVPVELLAPVR